MCLSYAHAQCRNPKKVYKRSLFKDDAVHCFKFPKTCQPYGCCEQVPNSNWPKHFGFFQPLSRTFSVPDSVCTEIFQWLVFHVKMYIKRETNPQPLAQEFPALSTRPHQHMKINDKKLKIIKQFGIFAEQNRKWKIPAYLPNYSSGQKGVQEKYLNMVVKINPVYWLKRNYSIWQDTKFRPITDLNSVNTVDVNFSLHRNETRAT